MVMAGDLTWGDKHATQNTDGVLKNCIPETYNFTNQCYLNQFNMKVKMNESMNKWMLKGQRSFVFVFQQQGMPNTGFWNF